MYSKRVLENISLALSNKRLSAYSQYFGSISTAILFLSDLRAANIVVPVPQNGSNTVSPQNENILTRRSASSSGYGAGWGLVEAPVIFQICWNHSLNCSFRIKIGRAS